jgi:hypothetical protein
MHAKPLYFRLPTMRYLNDMQLSRLALALFLI